MPFDCSGIRTVTTLVLLASCAFGQDVPRPPEHQLETEEWRDWFGELDASLRFSFGEHGEVRVWPSPAVGDVGSDETYPVVPEHLTWQPAMAWLGIYASALGGADLASRSDAMTVAHWFRRAGIDLIGDDALRHATIEEPPESPVGRELFRMLAIRVAEAMGDDVALGPLLAVAADPRHSPVVRRACEDAAAKLRGVPARRTPMQELMPIEELLALCPRMRPERVLVVDHWKNPHLQEWVTAATRAGRRNTESEILQAGGRVSLPMWAGAVSVTSGCAGLAFDLARRFGNHRVDRTVAVVSKEQRIGWICCDGVFDLDRLRTGLERAGCRVSAAVESATASFEARIERGMRLRAQANRLVLSWSCAKMMKLEARVVADIVSVLDGDEPVRAYARTSFVRAGGAPVRRIAFENVERGVLRWTFDAESEEGAEAWRGILRRNIDGALERMREDGGDDLPDALAGALSLAAEGTRLSVRLDPAGLDRVELLRAVSRLDEFQSMLSW